MAKRLKRNDTIPIFTASLLALPAINSPIMAPSNKPRITQKGGKKKMPIIIPIIENQIPCFEALNIFAPNSGSK